MDQVQRASPQPVSDGSPSHPSREQLLPADHAVLRLRQPSKQAVHIAPVSIRTTKFTFGPSGGLNVNFVRGVGSNCGLRDHGGQRWPIDVHGWRAECEDSDPQTSQKRLQSAVAAPGFDPLK
jgi:hypothetical protein